MNIAINSYSCYIKVSNSRRISW